MQNTTTQSDKKVTCIFAKQTLFIRISSKKTLLLKAVNVDLSTEESVTSQTS